MKGFKIGDQVIAYGNSESSYCGTIVGRRRNGYYELSVIDTETIVIKDLMIYWDKILVICLYIV